MARKKSLDEEQLTDTNYYILLAMTEPIHGYGIMQKIKEISEGTFEVGPASLYTSLKKMMEAGLIKLNNNKESDKKVYSLTEDGRVFLYRDYERRKKIVEHGKLFLEGDYE
jgi:DNA-binding PadR family transcriptional regulator